MNLMKRLFAIIALILVGSIYMTADELTDKSGEKIGFVYNVDFEMNFDNREYYPSAFSSSMTIFGARLTPSIGLSFIQKDGASHSIMAGVDVMKDFGASPISEALAGGKTDETSSNLNNLALFREITLYYHLEKRFGDTDMSLYAGVFPRRTMEGSYSQAFFSDSLKFYDNNLEGLLVKFRLPKARFEVGCDWMGQFGHARRERFMIFSSGGGKVAPMLSFGYSGYLLHFANSGQVGGVIDNILLNPYARLDIGERTGLQNLSFTLGYLQALQHNRKQVGYYVYPGGIHMDIEVRKWDVAIKNMTYYGTDLMPYYESLDAGGNKYGTELYFGDPFYRVFDDSTTGAGLYDRLEICYEPYIGKHVRMRIAAIFHMHNFCYSGCQQVVGLTASF